MKRLTLSVNLSEKDFDALHRAQQIVSSAADGTDLDVGREHGDIAYRLGRIIRRVKVNKRRKRSGQPYREEGT